MTTAQRLETHAETAEDAQILLSIGQAALEIGVKTQVLRQWEDRFACVRPLKCSSGRRYYRNEDVALLRALRQLLEQQGLSDEAAAAAIALQLAEKDATPRHPVARLCEAGGAVEELRSTVQLAVERGELRHELILANDQARNRLEALLSELTRLKSRVDRVRLAD